MKRVEFFFDLVSPYSYLAHTRVGRVCEAAGAELIPRPMLLGAVLNETGGRAATDARAPNISLRVRNSGVMDASTVPGVAALRGSPGSRN